MALTQVHVDTTRVPVARVTIANEESGNRLSERMLAELHEALDTVESTPGARVLVLSGQGSAFCAGMELEEIDDTWRRLVPAIGSFLRRLVTSSLVSVAYVDGAASGGGVGLAAACDHVVVGPCATFRMTELLFGLVPAAILPVVARRVGLHTAYGWALTSRELSGTEAVSKGLADAAGGEPALRGTLRGLRAAEPTALVALKDYYNSLAPLARTEGLVSEVLGRRFADPAVRKRLVELREQGLIT